MKRNIIEEKIDTILYENQTSDFLGEPYFEWEKALKDIMKVLDKIVIWDDVKK